VPLSNGVCGACITAGYILNAQNEYVLTCTNYVFNSPTQTQATSSSASATTTAPIHTYSSASVTTTAPINLP